MLTHDSTLTPLGLKWAAALAGLVVRHPNRESRCELHISGDDYLRVQVDRIKDTRDQQTEMRSPFVISCVRLACWPGSQLARQWFAAAFAGYCQHESLELVTFAGVAVLDPHAEPYASNPVNRGLRDGFPPVLTDESLAKALAVCMSQSDAYMLIGGAGE